MAQPPHAPPPHMTAPPAPQTPVQRSEPAAHGRAPEHLELKAIILLVFTLALIVGSALFLLRARGYFEPKQELVLITDNAEGVVAGMDLTFAGFPIGTVEDVSLGENGNVRIDVAVREKDAKWLRTSSIFTLEIGLFGGANLRAFSGVLTDPPLPDGAERPVLRGDANEQIQQVVGSARLVLDNLNEMTAASSQLNQAVENLQVFTRKLQSERGALHAIFGNEADARKLVVTIERANDALARVERLVTSADRLVVNADREVFGSSGIAGQAGGLAAEGRSLASEARGLAGDARATVQQMQELLGAARGSLQRVDTVLEDAQGISGSVRDATAELGTLRANVETNLRKIEDLINDLNRKWPFAKEREVQLP